MNTISFEKPIQGKELINIINQFTLDNNYNFVKTSSVPQHIPKIGEGEYVLGLFHTQKYRQALFETEKGTTISEKEFYDYLKLQPVYWDGIPKNISTSEKQKQVEEKRLRHIQKAIEKLSSYFI